MTADICSAFRPRVVCALGFVFLSCAFSLRAQDPPECSLSRTNSSCELVIDRSNPVAPATVQMYSDQQLTVIIKNPLPYERYFLDFTTAQAAVTPDVTSAIVQGLIPSLSKFQGAFGAEVITAGAKPTTCTVPEVSDPGTLPTAVGTVEGYVPKFQDCLADLARTAFPIYQHLEPYVAPDSLVPATPRSKESLDQIKTDIQGFLKSEADVSGKITAIAGLPLLKNDVPDAPALTKLANLQKAADAIATDLLGYYQRIGDLSAAGGSSIGFQNCDGLIDLTDAEKTAEKNTGRKLQCVVVQSRQDNERIYQNMTTRTVTYSLDALNLVANSQEAIPLATNKKALATIAINFADTPNKLASGVPDGAPYTALRWEASAGVFFSWLPNRTFTLTEPPNTCKASTGTPTVYDCTTRPTPVPFAAANYRLTGDFGNRWKQNVYATAAVGINPNNTTAEFGAGFSYAWRGFMASPLCHFGHDTRWTSMTPGSNGDLPTSSHWTEKLAIGISVRVPSLTGR